MLDETRRKPRHMRFIPLFLLMSLATGALAASTGAVVFPLQFRDLDTVSVKNLEGAISGQLARAGVSVLQGEALRGTLVGKGIGQQYAACGNANCASSIGKVLGVEKGVVGYVTTAGLTYVLNTRLIDVGSGMVTGTSRRSMNAWNSTAFGEIAPKVVQDLLTGNPAAPAEVEKSSQWGWWVAGAAVVAGTAAGVYLFLGAVAENSPKSPGGTDPNNPDAPSGSVTFTW